MSDLSSMSRERKKGQLRRRMISPDKGERVVPETGHGNEAGKPKNRGRTRRHFVILLIFFTVVAGIGFGIYEYFIYHTYTEYRTLWEKPVSEGGASQYAAFGGNVIKYTRDGASYIDNKGETKWIQPYEMKNPIISIKGDYAAIADQQGNTIYIFNKDGCQGTASTVRPIVKVAVAANGQVAAILEDSRASYIRYYDRDGSDTIHKKDGSEMVQEIKTVLSGDGYPLDIALSPDGSQIIVSFVYLDQREMGQRIVIYDFSEIGKNENHIVGGFDKDFKDSLAARVIYPNEDSACAFTDNGITFFSTKNLASIALVKKAEARDAFITSIFYSEKYAGMIVQDMMGSGNYRMDVYDLKGDEIFSKEFDYQYQGIQISGESVILYNENTCKIFNMHGVEKFSGELDIAPDIIVGGSQADTLIVTGQQIMKEIKLE
ncbi:DUF5711 family protein [Lachnospiraceae bacterium 62-35]